MERFSVEGTKFGGFVRREKDGLSQMDGSAERC